MIFGSEPLVSVMTMSYNYDKYIGETISSVLSQDYRNIQYIIVDDGSVDASVDVVRSFSDPRIELYVLPKNVGATAAFMEGYKKVRGSFVAWLDADDVFAPGKLRKQVNYLRGHPATDLLATYVDVIDAQSVRMSDRHPSAEWVNQPRDLNDLSNWIAQNYVAHSTVMIRREAHDAVGVLDPNMSASPDYDHLLRFVAAGYKFDILHEPLIQYRIHGNNQTHKAPEKTYLEMLYSTWKNVFPQLIERRRFPEVASRVHAAAVSEHFARMAFDRRMRLLSVIATSPDRVKCYKDFLEAIDQASPYSGMVMESILEYSPAFIEYENMVSNVGNVLEGIEWWRRQTEQHARMTEICHKQAMTADWSKFNF